jgi:hypothetical protein
MIDFILGFVAGSMFTCSVINAVKMCRISRDHEKFHEKHQACTECLRLNKEESLAFEMLLEDTKPNEAPMASVLRHPMIASKRGSLESSGWTAGSADDFLNDMRTESAYSEDDLARDLIMEYAEAVARGFAAFEIVYYLESQNFSTFRVMQILNDMVEDGLLSEEIVVDGYPSIYALNESKES